MIRSALETVADFFAAIKAEDWESAAKLLHPDWLALWHEHLQRSGSRAVAHTALLGG
jgi:hypothetical protein